MAPFVNAEEAEYLVIEDAFPNGRPGLEKTGVMFTTRDTVEKVERMKVCTCLNPLHTTLAVYGCLFGYTKISEEMKDSCLLYTSCGNARICLNWTAGSALSAVPRGLNPAEWITGMYISVRSWHWIMTLTIIWAGRFLRMPLPWLTGDLISMRPKAFWTKAEDVYSLGGWEYRMQIIRTRHHRPDGSMH